MVLASWGAHAQTAQPTIPGYMSTTCPGGEPVPCFIPYGATLPTSGGGGGSGSNAAAGTTGSAAPTSSSNTGFTGSNGNLTAVSPSAPLPVAGSGTAGTPAGGVVSIQGVSGGVAQAVTDTATASLSTAQSGSGLRVVPQAAAQQAPAGDTSVSAAASTSTVAWTTSTAARVLRVVPSNASCTMRSDGGTASATSTPIPGGYVWNLAEPPPNANVVVFCTTAATIAVSQGN